jgi:cobaltochelatase CobS
MNFHKEVEVKDDLYCFRFVNKRFACEHKFEWKKLITRKDKKNLKIAIHDHPNATIKKYARYIIKAVYPKGSFDHLKKSKGKTEGIAAYTYVLPPESKMVLSAIDRKKNIMIVGPSGCGKSRMVMELAQQLGKKLERVNLNGGTTDTSLVGEKGLRTDEKGNAVTYFQYGILPKAMKEGAILLLDEIDFAQPEYLAVLQAVFEGNGTPLTILDNEGERIYPHEDFRIIATANTLGRGDTNGYHGTNMLNIATLDRWSVIQMEYTKHEPKILHKIVGDERLVDKMMTLAKRIREAIKQGQLPDLVFSTRRLIHWAEALTDKSLNFVDATEVEVMGRLTKEERAIIGEFVKDIFAVKV